MKLFVGNLSWEATEEALKEAFGQHGAVVSVRIVRDPYGRSKGFGFVEMETAEAGEQVIQALNEQVFMGRPLRISQARQETPGQRPPRGDRGDRGPRRGGDRQHAGAGGRSFRPRFDDEQY